MHRVRVRPGGNGLCLLVTPPSLWLLLDTGMCYVRVCICVLGIVVLALMVVNCDEQVFSR